MAELREKSGEEGAALPSEGAVDDIAGSYADLDPLKDLCDKITAEGVTAATVAALLIEAASAAGVTPLQILSGSPTCLPQTPPVTPGALVLSVLKRLSLTYIPVLASYNQQHMLPAMLLQHIHPSVSGYIDTL